MRPDAPGACGAVALKIGGVVRVQAEVLARQLVEQRRQGVHDLLRGVVAHRLEGPCGETLPRLVEGVKSL